MLPSMTFNEYAALMRRGKPLPVTIVWRNPSGHTVFDEFVGGAEVAGKLRLMLMDLVYTAELHPNVPQRLNLAKGLGIDVVIDGQATKLQLSRAKVYPSAEEWHIVLQNWPYHVEVQPRNIKKIAHNGRFYLKTSWRTPVRLLLEMGAE